MRGPDRARLALGVVLLTHPDLPLRWLRCERSEPRNPRGSRGVRRTVRVLGARYVVQSVGGPWLHRSWVPEADAAVDVIHAASMLGLAGLAPRHRRLALASAATATAFALADVTPVVRPRVRPGALSAARGD